MKNYRKKFKISFLYGSDDEEIKFRYNNDKGMLIPKNMHFEGVIPNMERRYQETESDIVREELAKYLGNQPCPDCQGARLKKEARHVFIQE